MRIQTTYPLKELLSWLILIGIVSERWYELAILLVVNIVIVATSKQLIYSKGLFFTFFAIATLSIINIRLVGYEYDKFIQQFILLSTYSLCYYNFFKYIDRDIDSFFKKYLKLAYYMSFLGLIQFGVYFLIGKDPFLFMYGRDAVPEIASRIMRVSSILTEPSQLSAMLTPALVVILLGGDKFKYALKPIQKWVIIGVIGLTFSTITYLIAVLIIGYKYIFYQKNNIVRIAAASLAIVILIYFSMSGSMGDSSSGSNKEGEGAFADMTMKIEDTFSAFKEIDPKAFELLNLSTYATMTNIWVAMNAPQRIAGTGLGTHSQNYYSSYKSDYSYYGLNSEEGYSLFNRIFSEFGMIGAILFIFFLFRNLNKKNIISIAVFFFILSQAIRGGHYIRYGVILYLFLFYYSGWFYAKLLKRRNRAESKCLKE